MALSRRERRLLLAAGLLVIVLIAYLFLRPDPAPPAPARPAALLAPPPQPPSPAPPPPAPPPDLSGLRLNGLLASGAIIGFQDGRQRLVPIGRDALPGLILQRIEQNHAVLAGPAGEVRLGFDGAGQTAGAAAPAQATARDETLPYRLGLAPRREGGRVTGFTMRRGASLPVLERAGLRPGDVIVGVNGSAFDEERMLELPWQIANSTRTEIEIERGGRRVRMALQGR